MKGVAVTSRALDQFFPYRNVNKIGNKDLSGRHLNMVCSERCLQCLGMFGVDMF